ncbi:MAG TPA: nucleotidyltransferase domain-containing protein [Spirochaetota bacterium]|nr:nucleotidyltransferase domain-containing protein [Spirochaetota bacterium]
MADKPADTITDGLIQELTGISGVAAVYIFGSAAKGNLSAKSDLDIAVLFSGDQAENADRLDMMARLSAAAGRDVDLVILNDATPNLFHEILSTGKLVLENNRKYRIHCEVKNRKYYEDYRHIHSIYMQGMRRRYG